MKPVELAVREETFTCWKEIAAYLGKGVRTVQRWERESGLPVRRPNRAAAGIVSVSRSELDRWMARRQRELIGRQKKATVQESILESQGLHQEHRQVAHQVCEEMKKFSEHCIELSAKLTRTRSQT